MVWDVWSGSRACKMVWDVHQPTLTDSAELRSAGWAPFGTPAGARDGRLGLARSSLPPRAALSGCGALDIRIAET
eukprot:366021-Chlamydomonas_euryale.AAC.13